MSTVIVFSIIAFLFFLMGYFSKGITININNKQDEVPTEYNESMVDYMDPETRNYFDQNNGIHKY